MKPKQFIDTDWLEEGIRRTATACLMAHPYAPDDPRMAVHAAVLTGMTATLDMLCKDIARRLGTPFEVELPARYWDGTPIVLGRREENDTTE